MAGIFSFLSSWWKVKLIVSNSVIHSLEYKWIRTDKGPSTTHISEQPIFLHHPNFMSEMLCSDMVLFLLYYYYFKSSESCFHRESLVLRVGCTVHHDGYNASFNPKTRVRPGIFDKCSTSLFFQLQPCPLTRVNLRAGPFKQPRRDP